MVETAPIVPTGGAWSSEHRAAMSQPPAVLFLFDVDTPRERFWYRLIPKEHLADAYGAAARDRYWQILEELRSELGYVDYLGALERFRLEQMHRPGLLRMSNWLVDYPFADCLYPGALDVLKHVQQWGPAVILSDGDAVFQPRKVERSGLWRAVDNRVLIYVHKERELEDVERLYPANHYVLIDDKLHILAAVKKAWRDRVTTVFPEKQGHYAFDQKILADNGRSACQNRRSAQLRFVRLYKREAVGVFPDAIRRSQHRRLRCLELADFVAKVGDFSRGAPAAAS